MNANAADGNLIAQRCLLASPHTFVLPLGRATLPRGWPYILDGHDLAIKGERLV
jgi:hypothetical protein